jgi:hypothetical protein
MFGPRRILDDGTREFISPLGQGHIPLIALSDLGWWARYVFDAPRQDVSGRDIEVASEMVSWPQLAETFKRVTGLPAVYKAVTVEEWMNATPYTNVPIAADHRKALSQTEDGTATKINTGFTFRENFSGFYSAFRDDVVTRDMEWVRSVHPEGHTLESWMREHRYTGEVKLDVLKGVEDSTASQWHAVAKEQSGKL